MKLYIQLCANFMAHWSKSRFKIRCRGPLTSCFLQRGGIKSATFRNSLTMKSVFFYQKLKNMNIKQVVLDIYQKKSTFYHIFLQNKRQLFFIAFCNKHCAYLHQIDACTAFYFLFYFAVCHLILPANL